MSWNGHYSVETSDALDLVSEAVARRVINETFEALGQALSSGIVDGDSSLARIVTRRLERLLKGAVPGACAKSYREAR